MSEPEKAAVPPAPSTPAEAPAPPPGPAPAARETAAQQYKVVWREKSQPPVKPEPAAKPAPAPGPVPALTEDLQERESGPKLRDLDREIERELAEALGGFNEQEVLGAKLAPAKRPAPGTPPAGKKGKVVAIHGADVFLDVPGGRAQGVLPLLQFPEGRPEIGTEVDISIEGYDGANGLLLLSRRGAVMQADWSSVAAGMIVEARVTATNKGGLEVDVNGIRGFMPISQIDLYRVENTEQYVNQRLRCMVAEVNPEERNLVVSRRDLLEKEREENRERLWNELAEGQVRDGIVRSVKDFGAFVDLGGVDGLLHVSEMSWTRVQNAADVVQPGQAIKVVILKIDRERRKVSLGAKQLSASPWDTVGLNYPEGTVAKGKVTRIMDFGAFVELEPGIEGLVHISELSSTRVRKVSDVLQPGQEVQVKILSIDRNARRISLSLKATQAEAEEPAEEEAAAAEATEVKPPRPRTTPLRGGLGSR